MAQSTSTSFRLDAVPSTSTVELPYFKDALVKYLNQSALQCLQSEKVSPRMPVCSPPWLPPIMPSAPSAICTWTEPPLPACRSWSSRLCLLMFLIWDSTRFGAHLASGSTAIKVERYNKVLLNATTDGGGYAKVRADKRRKGARRGHPVSGGGTLHAVQQ